MKSVDIIVDSREPPEVKEVAVLHENVDNFEQKELPEGDIIVEDCIFERKTPEDLASSIKDGRLREQVERMADGGYRPFVLIEGDMDDFEKFTHTEMPSKSLRGMVASVIARNNIHVVFCSDQHKLVDMAVRIGRKTVENPPSNYAKTTETVKEPDFMENLFLGIEGIGMKTAEDLAEEFSTIESLMAASRSDIQNVKGIGDSRAKDILDNIHSGENSNVEIDTQKVYLP